MDKRLWVLKVPGKKIMVAPGEYIADSVMTSVSSLPELVMEAELLPSWTQH